jgi:hypothetical protein
MRKALVIPVVVATLLAVSVVAVLAVTGKPTIKAAAATFDLAPVANKLVMTSCTVNGTGYITESNVFTGKLVSSRADLNNMKMTATASISLNMTTGDAAGTSALTVRNTAGKRIAAGTSPIVGKLNPSDLSLSVRGMVNATMYNPTTQKPTGQHLIANYEAKVANVLVLSSHLVGSFGGAATADDFSVSWNGQQCPAQ